MDITQGPTQPSDGGDQPPNKSISIAKTCQDGSLPVIRTPSEAEKKKAKESKPGVVTLSLLPHSSPVSFVSTALLLLSSPQVQVVDLGDGGSSESESTTADEATKKTLEVDKGLDSSNLISQAPNNPFSSDPKIILLPRERCLV